MNLYARDFSLVAEFKNKWVILLCFFFSNVIHFTFEKCITQLSFFSLTSKTPSWMHRVQSFSLRDFKVILGITGIHWMRAGSLNMGSPQQYGCQAFLFSFPPWTAITLVFYKWTELLFWYGEVSWRNFTLPHNNMTTVCNNETQPQTEIKMSRYPFQDVYNHVCRICHPIKCEQHYLRQLPGALLEYIDIHSEQTDWAHSVPAVIHQFWTHKRWPHFHSKTWKTAFAADPNPSALQLEIITHRV